MYHQRARIVKRGRVRLVNDEFVFMGRNGERFALPLNQLRAQSMTFVPRRFHRRRWRRTRSIFSYLAWWVMGMAFFHRERRHWFFHTRDMSILRDPGWGTCPETDRRVKENRPRCIGLRRASFWAVLAFLGLWMFHPGFRTILSGPMVSVITPSCDTRLGEDCFERLQSSGRVRLVNDPALVEPLRRIFDRVKSGVPESKRVFDAEIYLADAPQVNAFALPGGKVVVLMGLLEQAEGEDELAGVLAHEIAHAQKRHHLRGVIEEGVCYVVWCMVGADQEWMTPWLASKASDMGGLRFSRDDEREADRTAVSYMSAAGYDPQALARMFERWAGERRDTPDWLVLVSTHPEPAERAELVRAWLAEQGDEVELIEAEREDWETYRQRVTAYLESRPGLRSPR